MMADGPGELMDLSVVISTYNRADLLASCLDALAAQALSEVVRWEVVVVDNNCTDATPAVVERARVAFPVPVRYVLERRQGVAFGRNAGVEQARGRLIAFTDDDVRPAPDWLASVLAAFVELEADALGGRVMPQWAAPVPEWVHEWLEQRQYRHTHIGILVHPERAHLTGATVYPPIWTANAAVKRDVFVSLGGFDTRMGRVKDKLFGGEDTDFIRRVVDRDLRVFYDPRLVVWHRISAERMTRRHFRRLRFEDAEGEARHLDRSSGRTLLGVRLYSYKRLARSLGSWLAAACRRRSDTFERELELQSAMGQLWGEFLATRSRSRTGRS
jgi:glucosyl-dolichyl phosphate glucuronosyltransferase